MDIIEKIYSAAKQASATIILAEADDERVREAAKKIEEQQLAKLILIGKETDGLNATFINPQELDEELVKVLIGIRKELSEDEARKLLTTDTKFLAATMVAAGKADGYVSGNLGTTADTIRPALKIIKATFASSYFIMILKEQILFFADCAMNVDPTPEQLAQIGVDTAKSAALLGIEPRVAFLSFSTKGSGGSACEKIAEATEIAKDSAPDVAIDGELQFDAAFIPDVAKIKAPDSPLKGNANVFIFPDLNSANIAYKITQRLANARAVGPILQGLNKPVNDLSRGCSAQDIVDVVAVTAMQAHGQ